MFGEHRKMGDYIVGLETLVGTKDRFDEIWPSHADIPLCPQVIQELLDGVRKMQNREIPGVKESFHGRSITAYDLGFTVMLCD